MPYSLELTPGNFWAFPTMKRELQGKKFWSYQWSAACFQEVGGALWEVHCLPERYFEKETVTAPPQISDSK
jgi:hypothetical protein